MVTLQQTNRIICLVAYVLYSRIIGVSVNFSPKRKNWYIRYIKWLQTSFKKGHNDEVWGSRNTFTGPRAACHSFAWMWLYTFFKNVLDRVKKCIRFEDIFTNISSCSGVIGRAPCFDWTSLTQLLTSTPQRLIEYGVINIGMCDTVYSDKDSEEKKG